MHLLGPEGGVQHLPRSPADVSEKHVLSLLLHKNIMKLEYFGENASKSFFSCTYSDAESHNDAESHMF